LDNQGIVGLQRQIIKGTFLWPIIHAIVTIKCSDNVKGVAGCDGWSIAFHFHRPRQIHKCGCGIWEVCVAEFVKLMKEKNLLLFECIQEKRCLMSGETVIPEIAIPAVPHSRHTKHIPHHFS
jgi:hypothetical protein